MIEIKSHMDRVLSREAMEQENYPAVEKLRIGVVGISKHAGSSFVAGCLARFLANTKKHSPAVLELGNGSLYDAYGMDKRFAGRLFFQFYSALEANENIKGKQNIDEGVNWILKTPLESSIGLTFEQKLRLTVQARGDIIICDLSGEGDINHQLLRSMDRVLVVIDPLPSKMLEGYLMLCNLKAFENDRNDIIYIINKINKGVNKRQMLDFLNVKNPVMIPLINPEHIYTAEYNCKIPYSIGEVRNVIQEPLAKIVALLNLTLVSDIKKWC